MLHQQNKLECLCLEFFIFYLSVGDEECFIRLTVTPGSNVIKLFLSVIYKLCNKLECLSPTFLFQPSLMFVGKARSPP